MSLKRNMTFDLNTFMMPEQIAGWMTMAIQILPNGQEFIKVR